jgi:iron complex outermembrane receptor protein
MCAAHAAAQPLSAGAPDLPADAPADATAAGAGAAVAAPPLTETIQTVMVTTRRRLESAQNVPTPMTVLGAEQLEANRVYRAQDLQQLLPSTTINYVHAR